LVQPIVLGTELDRRRILVAITACLCGAAGQTSAQSGKVYRIGLLETTSASANKENLEALLRGLREAGYVEGKNIVIDYRSVDGRPERFPELAADLIRARPDVIVARGTNATVAAKKQGSVPIVMTSSADPVAAHVVPDLAKPGGQVTGLTSIVSELDGKRLEIMQQLRPDARRFAVMLNFGNPAASPQRADIERAAAKLKVEALFFDVRDREGLRRAIEEAAAKGVGGVFLSTPEVSAINRRMAVELLSKHKLAGIQETREFPTNGGLMSYGVYYPDLYYRAAAYVDKILKGTKPGELPIERPTKLELVINLKTAKEIGVTIPRELLVRADEVIQ